MRNSQFEIIPFISTKILIKASTNQQSLSLLIFIFVVRNLINHI